MYYVSSQGGLKNLCATQGYVCCEQSFIYFPIRCSFYWLFCIRFCTVLLHLMVWRDALMVECLTRVHVAQSLTVSRSVIAFALPHYHLGRACPLPAHSAEATSVGPLHYLILSWMDKSSVWARALLCKILTHISQTPLPCYHDSWEVNQHIAQRAGPVSMSCSFRYCPTELNAVRWAYISYSLPTILLY